MTLGERMPRIGFTEFVLLVAAISASQAVAIDIMLPAFPLIVASMHVANPNHGQWILTAYMVGLGVGQLFWGLLSDRFGRRPILLTGLALYSVAALLSGITNDFHALLIWRCIHGLAAASATVTRSMVRDLYSGRSMARVMSLTFIVFLLVPILAPSIGQLILLAAPWRFTFIAASAFAACIWFWALFRLQESHADHHMTLTWSHIGAAVRLVLGNRQSLLYTFAMSVMFGSIMAYVGMVQQLFSDVFHRPNVMPRMFALCALSMSVAAFTNSRLVERLGMRHISHTALLSYIGIAAVHVLIVLAGAETLWTFVALQGAAMACVALCVSNFGAMAMEPVGAVAGIGASLQGAISTFGGAMTGAFIGRLFNGTTLPLVAGALCCGLASVSLVLIAERGRLFKGQSTPAPRAIQA